MRPITSYDYPSITRNLSRRGAWEVWRAARVSLGLALFLAVSLLCMAAMAAGTALYDLGKKVVPREFTDLSQWLE